METNIYAQCLYAICGKQNKAQSNYFRSLSLWRFMLFVANFCFFIFSLFVDALIYGKNLHGNEQRNFITYSCDLRTMKNKTLSGDTFYSAFWLASTKLSWQRSLYASLSMEFFHKLFEHKNECLFLSLHRKLKLKTCWRQINISEKHLTLKLIWNLLSFLSECDRLFQ